MGDFTGGTLLSQVWFLQASPFAGQEYQVVSNYCRIHLRMISETETGPRCIRREFRRFHVLWVKW